MANQETATENKNPQNDNPPIKLSGPTNSANTPLMLFELQQEDIKANLSLNDSKYSVDFFNTAMKAYQENPDFNMGHYVYNMDNVNGPNPNAIGFKNGLRFKMNPDNEYYKKLHPGVTDELIDGIREEYKMWEDLYVNGGIERVARASGHQLTKSAHYMQQVNPDLRLTTVYKQSLGFQSPTTSAFSKDYYYDLDMNKIMGKAVITSDGGDGRLVNTQLATQIINDPNGPGYVFKQLGLKKEAINIMTTVPFGTNMAYHESSSFDATIAKGGRYLTYTNDVGEEEIIREVGYNSSGQLITSNKYLGEYRGTATDNDIRRGRAILKLLNLDDHSDHNFYKKDFESTRAGGVITIPKQFTHAYRDDRGFMKYMTHQFQESYFQLGAWVGNMVFDSPKWDNKYYEALGREYQMPVGLDLSSPYYYRNMATMSGDLLAQIIPSIIVSAATGGLAGALGGGRLIAKTAQVGAKGLAKNVAKKKVLQEGVKRTVYLGEKGGQYIYKKSAYKQVINKYVFPTIQHATWMTTAAGQQGFGTYHEGIQSGINDHDAAMVSLMAAGITLITSRLFEPSYIRPGFYVAFQKPMVSKTLGNLFNKMGIQTTMKEGKIGIMKKGIDALSKAMQRKGVGGWFMGRGIDGLFEALQETSEQLGVAGTMWMYNRYSKETLGKRIGEGRYDVKQQIDQLGSSFILGGLMGTMASAVNPMVMMHAIKTRNVKTKTNDDYMLYNDFYNIGVDKVVRHANEIIIDKHSKSEFGSSDLDVQGNPMTTDENGKKQGATEQAAETISEHFEGGILRTENDVMAHSMLLEVFKEADTYNKALSSSVIQDVNADLLISLDQRNNIAVNTALAYKELQTKTTRADYLKNEMENKESKEDKKQLQEELDILMGKSVIDPETIAYSQDKYDKWTKPMNSILRDGERISNYNYSQYIQETIVSRMITLESLPIWEALRDNANIDTDLMQDTIFSALVNKPDLLFETVTTMNDLFGSIDAISINRETGEYSFSGLGKLIKNWNSQSQQSKHTTKELKGLQGQLSNITAMLSKGGFTSQDVGNVMNVVSQELNEMFGKEGGIADIAKSLSTIGDEDFTAAAEGVRGEVANVINALDNLDYKVHDDDNDFYALSGLNAQKESIKEYSTKLGDKGLLGEYEAAKKRSETKIDIDVLDGIVSSKETDAALDEVFKQMMNLINGDIRLSFFDTDLKIAPRFKFYTVSDFVNFLIENKNNALDENTMYDIQSGMEILHAYNNHMNIYMWGLSQLSKVSKEDAMYHHTYMNEITKRLLENGAEVTENINKIKESLDAMYLNMMKNGFTREKENIRYLCATISNTDLYLNTIGRDNFTTFLNAFFAISNDNYEFPTKDVTPLEKALIDKVTKYLKEKNIPKEQWSEVFKKMDEDLLEIKKATDEYYFEVNELLNKGLEIPEPSEDENFSNVHTVALLGTRIEQLYQSTDENKHLKIQEHKELMNKIYALQWKMRSKFSDKLTLHMLMAEAVAETNHLEYQFLGEHEGRKLYIDDSNTTEDGSTVFRGTFAPGDMEAGKRMLFYDPDEVSRKNREGLINLIRDNGFDIEITDEVTDGELRDKINSYFDDNHRVRKGTAMHLIMTNLSIDHNLNGRNISTSQIFNMVKQYSRDRILNNPILTAKERKAISEKIIYDGHRINIEESIKALTKYFDTVNNKDLKSKSETIFQSLRMNINIEQETALLQVVANLYRNMDGNFKLGMNISPETFVQPFNNSICVLGGGGTGKSTMVMENYFYILKRILKNNITSKEGKIIPPNKKIRILTLSPNEAVSRIQSDNINKIFNPDEVEHNPQLFHDAEKINEEYDIVVIDEASLIDPKSRDKKFRTTVDRGMIQEALGKAKAKQVVILYDNNQTLNSMDLGANVTDILGERTIPLQTRYRNGYTDLNSLVDFFTGKEFVDFYKYNEGNSLPPLMRGNHKINTRYKHYKMENLEALQGVRIVSSEQQVIDDYNIMKNRSNSNMIVVRTKLEKERLINAYDVRPSDVHILEFGDRVYNVSGKGAQNVFVIIDYDNVFKGATIDAQREYANVMLSKWFNTAITRVQGEGYLSLLYKTNEEHSTEIEALDVLPKYNDVLNFENIDNSNKPEIIKAFNKQAVIEMAETNNINDRYKAVQDEFGEVEEPGVTPTTPIDAPQQQHVAEDISKKVREHIEKLTRESNAKKEGVEDVANLVYKDLKQIDGYTKNINNLLRACLKQIFKDYTYGEITLDDIKAVNNVSNIYDKAIQAFKEHTQGSEFDIEAYEKQHGEKGLKLLLHNIIMNSILSTGLETMIGLNVNTTIVDPELTGKINGEDYMASPLMINAVGYETVNGKEVPIFDVYMVDFSRAARTKESPISDGTMKNAIYSIGLLAKRGYKVNKIHFLNYNQSNIQTKGKKVWMHTDFVADNILSKADMVAHQDYISIINSIEPDMEVFVPEDTLLKMGVKAPISDSERHTVYISKQGKNRVYIKAKQIKKVDGELKVFVMLSNDTIWIEQDEFNKNHTAQFANVKHRADHRAVVKDTIFAPVHGIPIEAASQDIGNTRDEFYGHNFFRGLRERIANIKTGDNIEAEYVDNTEFFIYNEHSRQVEKVNYRNAVIYKINGEVVGVQERITYGNENLSNETIDNLIAKYVNGEDNIAEIRKALEEIEIESEVETGPNPYKDGNIDYQIEKIIMMREVKEGNALPIVKEVTAGTLIISTEEAPQTISQLLEKLETTDKVEWMTMKTPGDQFGLVAYVTVDGKRSPIYMDAAKVDKEYIREMKSILKEVKKMYKEQSKTSNFVPSELAAFLKQSELTDFLYANRERVSNVVELFESNRYLDFELHNKVDDHKAIFGEVITKIEMVLEFAEKSLGGAMDIAFNKAIFAVSSNTEFSESSVYANNLLTKVQDISAPAINVTTDNETQTGIDTKINQILNSDNNILNEVYTLMEINRTTEDGEIC